MTQEKVIKRYANRKLYDTERSCYVTLEEIAQMVKEGEDLTVIDNKSKDDLTAVTLAQIIVEEEKKVNKMPLNLLRSIIQSSNEAIGDFYQKRVADPVTDLKGTVEKRVSGIFRREDGTPPQDGETPENADPSSPAQERTAATDEEAGRNASGPEGSGEQSQVRAFVTSATNTFDRMQAKIDDRVKEGLSRMTHLSHMGTDVEKLRSRIDRIDQRIRSLEEPKSSG